VVKTTEQAEQQEAQKYYDAIKRYKDKQEPLRFNVKIVPWDKWKWLDGDVALVHHQMVLDDKEFGPIRLIKFGDMCLFSEWEKGDLEKYNLKNKQHPNDLYYIMAKAVHDNVDEGIDPNLDKEYVKKEFKEVMDRYKP
jgi:hypothetical protein